MKFSPQHAWVWVGPDRVSKYVKQSSDVWPFFWKLFGGLILIFTTSFDIWYFDKTISFGKHILYRQPFPISQQGDFPISRRSSHSMTGSANMKPTEWVSDWVVNTCHLSKVNRIEKTSLEGLGPWASLAQFCLQSKLTMSLFLVCHNKKKHNISCL